MPSATAADAAAVTSRSHRGTGFTPLRTPSSSPPSPHATGPPSRPPAAGKAVCSLPAGRRGQGVRRRSRSTNSRCALAAAATSRNHGTQANRDAAAVAQALLNTAPAAEALLPGPVRGPVPRGLCPLADRLDRHCPLLPAEGGLSVRRCVSHPLPRKGVSLTVCRSRARETGPFVRRFCSEPPRLRP